MGTRQDRSILFRDCRQFIAGEVEILRPDIIVTQGTWARGSLVGAFPVLQQDCMPDNPQYSYKVVQLARHEAIKFDSAHPQAIGLFWREKKVGYPRYVQAALRFVLEHRPSATAEYRKTT